MSTEANKLVFRSIPEKVFNAGRLELLDQYLAADIVDHLVPPDYPAGIEGSRRMIGEIMAAFPDFNATVTHIIGEGEENVAGRLECTATHLGTFFGVPATGRKITWTESHFGRIVDGKLVEHWGELDIMGIMQQMGAIPAPAPQPANDPATA